MPTSPTTYLQRLRAKYGGASASDDYERRRMANPKLRLARTLRSSARYRHKFRPWFLSRHPLCEQCQASGRVKAAVHVHHVRGLAEYPGDLCDESRCRALCVGCHAAAEGKTRGQTNQRGLNTTASRDAGSSETECRDVNEVNERGISPTKTPLVGSNRGIVS